MTQESLESFKLNAGTEFSRFKYGDPAESIYFASQMADLIYDAFGPQIDEAPDQWILVFPAVKHSLFTSATLMTAQLHRILEDKFGWSLTSIQLKRRAVYAGDFGQLKSQVARESKIFGHFYYDGPDVRGKHALFIEDALVSGTHYKETQRVLVEEARVPLEQIHSFFIADVWGETFGDTKYSVEDTMNHVWIDPEHPERLIEILNLEGVQVTSRMVKFMLRLPEEDLSYVLSRAKSMDVLSDIYYTAEVEELDVKFPAFKILYEHVNARLAGFKRELGVRAIYTIHDEGFERTLSTPLCAAHPHLPGEGEITLRSLYSLSKYGDWVALERFAELLTARIREDLGARIAAAPEAWGVATVGYTTLPGSARVLAERISARLGLPLVSINRADIPAVAYGALGRAQERRDVVAGAFKLDEGEALREHVLIIEDAVVSGAVMRELRGVLSEAGAAAYPYALVDVASPNLSLERALNSAIIDEEKPEALIALLNDPRTVFVARTLKTLLSLEPEVVREVVDRVEDLEVLVKAFNLARLNRLDYAGPYREAFEALAEALNARIRARREIALPPYEPLYIFTDESLATLGAQAVGYSKLKYGEPEALTRFTEALCALIEARLGAQIEAHPEGWVVAATHYYRAPNAAQILGARVAARLGLPFADVRRRRIYGGEFGALSTPAARREVIRDNAYCANPALIGGRRVIYVDDAFVGGTHLEEHLRMLREAGARDVCPFSLIDVADADLTLEARLNYAWVDADEPARLLEILADPDAALITRTVKYLLRLGPARLLEALTALPDERVYEILEYAEVEGYGELERFEASLEALEGEALRRHLLAMRPLSEVRFDDLKLLLLDYDDTLAETLSPLTRPVRERLTERLKAGVEIGVISLQPIGDRGLSEFMLTSMRAHLEAEGEPLSLLDQLRLLPSEGIACHRVSPEGEPLPPEYNLGFDAETWAGFKRIVVDEIGGAVAKRVFLRGGYISLHFETEADLERIRAALDARLADFTPSVETRRKKAADPNKKVLHVRLTGIDKAIGRHHMLTAGRAALEARLGRKIRRDEILVAGDKMGVSVGERSDAAMFVYGAVNLALGDEARAGAHDELLGQRAAGLEAWMCQRP